MPVAADTPAAATPPRASAPADARPTPMMAQYIEIKAANPDCLLFYRMGDFYELFFEDAEVASRALGIVLTKRGKHLGDDIPMCGVPIDRADDYLQRLIALGHRVAVCEQIEDPAEARKRGPKSVVQRQVVRLVTPGTITEERLLDPHRANAFAAVARVKTSDDMWRYGIACVDISTGAFSVTETDGLGLWAELARLDPREIVAADSLCADDKLAANLRGTGVPLTPLGRESSDGVTAERRLCGFYGVATLDGFGALSRAETSAAAMALHFIERTQINTRPNLARPARVRHDDVMEIDAATRANLELTRTLSGERVGSLVATIDRTVTPAGTRLLAERLAAPLTDANTIARRLASLSFFLENRELRRDIRAELKRAPDFMRSLSRLALGRGGPRDLDALHAGLVAADRVSRLISVDQLPDDLDRARTAVGQVDRSIADLLAATLAPDLPLDRRAGNFIAAGCDAALDEARALRDESRRVIAGLQARYADIAEIRQIKIKHNNFLGYFIEVPQAQGEKLVKPPLNATFIHRQTMADAMRFSTAELSELDTKIASAADRALGQELAIFDRLVATVLDAAEPIKAAAQALAEIDVAAALAEIAAANDWVKPEIESDVAFCIEQGCHPVVEAALDANGEAFVANDCDLSGDGDDAGRIAIVTGPNMAGKSTYLRQNALIVVLAQMGSYVPAKRARLGIVDRLFSRVGAADDLARGRSTFMVEMVETAAILNQATARSLVILDEIGRGTATFDGLSIAWATTEHLHEKNRARALFATHFHELTELAKQLPRVVNLTMRVTDWNGEVVFLHEVLPGAADRSYGIQVAKLAGLPPAVVGRAQEVLRLLEASDRRTPVETLIADLPLFSHAAQHITPVTSGRPADPLRETLAAIDPDALSPREALQALYKLKESAREKQ
ncbi:MAG: mismatch repair protein MutS [Methylobacteriaceae bacterium]|jgi:DNA mismatch repair protein MutS|nr:mismatch repair protein MutS [Methylobacteriaceae bacterium]